MPASFTGVFGFAFSAGRVSMAGAANLAPSFGRLGVLARSPHVVVKVRACVWCYMRACM